MPKTIEIDGHTFGTGYEPEELDENVVDRYRTSELPQVRSVADTSRARKLWGHGALLNQRQLPACLGFSWTGELIASPFGDRESDAALGYRYGKNHWQRAQYIRYGELRPDSGASIHAGADVAMQRELIGAFAWARTITEIRDAVVTTGPVVLGIPWLNSMSQCRKDGHVRVRFPDGYDRDDIKGGHAVVITGYDYDAPILESEPGRKAAFRIRNSWGTHWGAQQRRGDWNTRTGTGWILVDDLEALLDVYYPHADGTWYDTACLPLDRRPVDVAALLAAHPDPTVS